MTNHFRIPSTSRAVTLVVAVVALTVAACSDSDSTSTPATTPPSSAAGTTEPSAATTVPATTAASTQPSGMIAIGHSGMTGFNADPARPEQNAWDLSWATGDAVEVNSIAGRFIASHPSAEGRIWNAANNGADVSGLVRQAEDAFDYVPMPELVLVQVIDNDIRCDGSDAENVPVFGAQLADVLQTITAQSPTAKIVVFGYLGFPTPELVEQFVARTPELKAGLSGDGMCDPYNSSGDLVPANFDHLRDIVRGYEAEQERVCAAVPTCVTDGGLSAQFPESLDLHADDGHLNAAGHATAAELMWPVVAEALGI